MLTSYESALSSQTTELDEIEMVPTDVVALLGDIAMTGCPIYPDCPTPNSCSNGCKYGGVTLSTTVE